MPKTKTAKKATSGGSSRKQSIDETKKKAIKKKVVESSDDSDDSSSEEEVKAPVVQKRARAASVNWTIFSSRFSENVSTVMEALTGPLIPITLVPGACP